MKSLSVPACAFAALAFASSSRAGVLVVDANGAGDHLDLQAAVDAAVEGDTILLRRPPVLSTRFGGTVIDGKSLLLQGDMLDPARVGPIVVRNLAPDQRVELSYLHINPLVYPLSSVPAAVGLTIESNEGLVWIHRCDVRGGMAVDGAGAVALRVRSSDATIVTDSHVEGGRGWEDVSGGRGIETRDAVLWLYETEVVGGKGGDLAIGSGNAGVGGDGATLRFSHLYAAKSLIRGGEGGDAFGGESHGGDGLVVHVDSTARLFDTELLGGAPSVLSDGTFGLPLIGPATIIPGSAPALESPRTAAAGTDVTLHFAGEPGDTVFLLLSERAVAPPLGSVQAYLHVGAPFRRLHVGTLPASGEATFQLTLPHVPTGGASALVMQAVHLRPGIGRVASGPELLVMLDPQYVPQCGGRIYVDADAPPGGDGTSWATAFRDLRVGLGSVPECPGFATEVWVAEGAYRPDGPGGDWERTFYAYSDTHVYGGFAGGETLLTERDPMAHPVILSGDLNGDDTPGFGNRSDNSSHVLQSGGYQFMTRNVRLDGLVVSGGYARTQGTDQVAFRGGGMYAQMSGGLQLVRCTFTDNHADVFGGGVYWLGDALSVSHCRFVGNRAGQGGAGQQGGGMYLESGGPVQIANTLVAGNVSTGGAGVALRTWTSGSSTEVKNCVVYANRSTVGAGISAHDIFDEPMSIANTISWGNVATSGSGQDVQILVVNDAAVVEYCCVQDLGGFNGPGNIGTDPGFVDPLGPDGIAGTLDDDLRLSTGSTCVDAGSNGAAAADFTDIDHDGDVAERVSVDLAWGRRFRDDPNVVDTGEGTSPIIDMGAYERAP